MQCTTLEDVYFYVAARACILLFVDSSHPERDTEAEQSIGPRASADSLMVHGSKTTVQPRSAVKKSLTPRTAGTAVPVGRRAKVRNYNVKDDSSDRHR